MILSQVKTRTGTEGVIAYSVDEVELPPLRFSKMSRNRTVYQYSDTFAVADTETSHAGESVGWVYQWAFKLGETYVYGRKPSEFIRLFEKIRDHYSLTRLKRLIIYFHNSSYDLQYLKHYLRQYDEKIRILATDPHSFLICDIFGFRILCSYRLTNLSLDTLSKDYAEKYLKASGAVNYNVLRYQDSELKDNDWYYMFSDVASQYDAITQYLKSQGYEKAWKAPFTSTGFVRTNCRHAAEHQKGWRDKFNAMRLDLEQYNLYHAAFMGGITIASYLYADRTIKGDIGHRDFRSSYPCQQMTRYFPVGKPFWYGNVDSMEELESICEDYCVVFLLHLKEVHIKPGVTAPYIPSSKCIWLEDGLKLNGKVVYAKSLTIAVTEIDFKWIRKQYTAKDPKVDHVLCSERGPAPAWLKSEVMRYYTGKCTLKHSDPVLYMASKALLNAIYGMSATAPVRDEYDMDEDCIINKKESDPQAQLNKFYASYNSFMPYQLGVYTTAWARDMLMTMIETVGYDRFLYCDTDSVFYLKDEGTEERLRKMNEEIIQRAKEAGAYVGDQYLGEATEEDPITAFRALHAKCYAMIENGSLKVTIAGIPKSSVKWNRGHAVKMTNAEELGNIEKLEDGFIFRHCGGTRCIYIEDEPRIIKRGKHEIESASAAIISNIEKELSDTMYTVGKDYSLLTFTQDVYIPLDN